MITSKKDWFLNNFNNIWPYSYCTKILRIFCQKNLESFWMPIFYCENLRSFCIVNFENLESFSHFLDGYQKFLNLPLLEINKVVVRFLLLISRKSRKRSKRSKSPDHRSLDQSAKLIKAVRSFYYRLSKYYFFVQKTFRADNLELLAFFRHS